MNLFVNALAMTMITLCYAPQIYKLIKTKNADSQSFLFWVMLSVALGCNVYIAYDSALLGGGWQMFGIQVANTVLALWTLGLVWMYQRKQEGNE